ncbi:hypothetical protein R1538_34795 [Rhizobium leguminosarum]|uniref:hypothetical protein n=1 Tax=Rhizobium leguminosarum TaxID=384 RepID=UPI00293DFCC6|nr:hypothetical protein [Rhizobium leguminosarum]MDV4166221.1 hypothetical protein [Rhizobium leguminosarum]
MINPTEEDIGKTVIYRRDREQGVITSFNDHMVFVRYGSAQGSMGTLRRDLDWAHDYKFVPELITGSSLPNRKEPVPLSDGDEGDAA